MRRHYLSLLGLALMVALLASCGADAEPGKNHFTVEATTNTGVSPQGSITIESVQVTAGEQIVVQGQSTLPDGACLGSELWADGELQAWWPGEVCVPVQGDAWQMSVRLGRGEVPAELDTSAQYMLRVYQQNGPDIVAVFAFDLAGPPEPEPPAQ